MMFSRTPWLSIAAFCSADINPLIAIIGIPGESFFNVFIIEGPSIFGIEMSVRTTDTLSIFSAKLARPSTPLEAVIAL